MSGVNAPRILTGTRWLGVGLFLVFLATMLRAAPDSDYAERRSKLIQELADEHCTLGRWCVEHKLYRQAQDEFEWTLVLQPGHRTAAEELGKLAKVTRRTQNLKCVLKLTTGDEVKADLLLEAFRIQTPSGSLLIPSERIDFIRLGGEGQSDRIYADDFTGEVNIQAKVIPAKSTLGTLTVQRGTVSTIRVCRPCADCSGTGQVKCQRCDGKGRIYETIECETCHGELKVQCERCGGTGRLTCGRCGGQGYTVGTFGGISGRYKCTRCDGRGTVDCPYCQKGLARCPTCMGRPIVKDRGNCPDCEARKTVACKTCAGTGVRPFTPPDETPPVPPQPTPTQQPQETQPHDEKVVMPRADSPTGYIIE